jgi:hypothetical protein
MTSANEQEWFEALNECAGKVGYRKAGLPE